MANKYLKYSDEANERGDVSEIPPPELPTKNKLPDVNNPFKGMFAGQPLPIPNTPPDYSPYLVPDPEHSHAPPVSTYYPYYDYATEEGIKADKDKVIKLKLVDLGEIDDKPEYIGEADSFGFIPPSSPELTGDPKTDTEILKQAIALNSLYADPESVVSDPTRENTIELHPSDGGYYYPRPALELKSLPKNRLTASGSTEVESLPTEEEAKATEADIYSKMKAINNTKAVEMFPYLPALVGVPRKGMVNQ